MHISLRFTVKFVYPKKTIRCSAANLTTAVSPPSREPLYSRQDLTYFLQSCISSKSHYSNFHKIHSFMIISGLVSDMFLNNVLLSGYSKSGQIQDARLLFDRMIQRNIISWSTVLSMYSQNNHGQEALILFSEFRRSFQDSPNEFILASVLRSCVQLRDVDHAMQLHNLTLKLGLNLDVYVGTSLVNIYSKFGFMDAGKMVFDELPVRNSVTWTTIIAGYTQIGKGEVSLALFSQMKETGLQPDRFVISSIMSACSSLCYLEGGRQIHGYVYRNGIELDVSVNNVLIDFYSKCSRVNLALRLFDQMLDKNAVSWTTMIAGYMQNSYDCEAMELFLKMNQLGLQPDAFACTSVMTSCGSLMSLLQGMQVHAYAVKANLEGDEYVKNGLIDMYAKCNSLADAKTAFDVMPEHNVVSYNAMIEGFASQDKLEESIKLFNMMRSKSLYPSPLTFVSLLGVSASQCAIDLSKQIHGLVIKSGVSLDLYSGSSLVDVYSKCSCVGEARAVFEEIDDRDVVVWNAMLSGYTKNDEGEKSLLLYQDLCHAMMKPNEFTFVALVTAASNLASLFHGLQFHAQIIKVGVDSDSHISNALVDMYAKCGSIEEAKELFHFSCGRDVVCWNNLISRHAEHGHAVEAVGLFNQMRNEGVVPNHVTFLGVLSACSHVGLVKDGLLYFNSMKVDFQLEPDMEHYACIVGLLGRAGRLHEAKEFIEKMPIEPSAIVWRNLLSACKVFGDVVLGKYAAEMAIKKEPSVSGSYILLSNIFASKGMWVDAEKVRKGMDNTGVLKEPGYSWIEVNHQVHAFTSKDKGNLKVNSIYSALNLLTRMIKGVDNEYDGIIVCSDDG